MALSPRRLAIAILVAALAIRVAWVFATPDYRLVHDALDYNRHAISLANGDGFALSYGRETAFRPPAYPIFLAAVYWIFGPSLEWARLANALVGTGIVALIGVISLQVWNQRVALIAMALGAVYIPLILVGQSVMSEPLFVLCMLGAIACALKRWALAAGVLMGLAILGRANALILLLPLAWAVWKGPRPALIMIVAAALTVIPWTIRNYVVLDQFVPVSTQLGSALAGTYNSEAMNNRENPAAWMSLKRVDDYRPIFNRVRETNEAVLEKQLRSASLEYIKEHPGAPLKVAWWTSRRMLDLGGWDWAIHTAGTVSAGKKRGRRGDHLLLAVRDPGRDRRVHPARAGSPAVAVVHPAADVPRRRLPRGGDAALPDGDRSVRDHARRAGDLSDRGQADQGPIAPTGSREGTRDRLEEVTGGGEVGAQLVLREPDLVRAVVARVRERRPGEVGLARLRLVAEERGQADPAVARARLQHARRLVVPEDVERAFQRLPDERGGGVRPRAAGVRIELVQLRAAPRRGPC